MVSSRLGAALGVFHLTNTALATLDPIVANGQYFFFSGNGSQFFMRGVAYQQGVDVDGTATSGAAKYTDPLADETSCRRDVPLLQQLGTNTIRVYAVDPTKDHSTCMSLLDAAGIYVIADLSSPDESIERDSPAWTTILFERFSGVIDSLSRYTNTIGFFAGNEVTNNNTNTQASAFVKAAVRDSKKYIKSKNLGRWLGVGYATNDDADTRNNLANYFNCGDADESVDFWGYNIYEWCGQSTFQSSGYEERTNFFRNFSVPVFFSEYGCQNPGGAAARVFQETGVLYSDDMNSVWSGGIVYEYFQEQNDYGLVSLSGSSATTMKDFGALATQIARSGYPTGTASASYTPSNTAQACPAVQSGWQASDTLPPSPNSTVCECMYASLACVPATDMSSNGTALGIMIGQVCGLDPSACDGISANATTGRYGAFAGCNATQKLGSALNAYYANQNSASTACDFGGLAKVVSASAASGCSAVLSAATSSAASGSSGSGDGASAASSLMRADTALMVGSVLVSLAFGFAAMLL